MRAGTRSGIAASALVALLAASAGWTQHAAHPGPPATGAGRTQPPPSRGNQVGPAHHEHSGEHGRAVAPPMPEGHHSTETGMRMDGMMGAEALLAEGRRHSEAALRSLDELAGALRDLELEPDRAAALARAKRALQEARQHVDHSRYGFTLGQDVQLLERQPPRAALGRAPEHHHAGTREMGLRAPAAAAPRNLPEGTAVLPSLLGTPGFRTAGGTHPGHGVGQPTQPGSAPPGARTLGRVGDLRAGETRAAGETVLGSQVFRLACAGCHGTSAEGKIGPRLVGIDHDAAEIEEIVTHGLPPRMPAFGQQLAPAEIQAVAAYIRTLGTGR